MNTAQLRIQAVGAVLAFKPVPEALAEKKYSGRFIVRVQARAVGTAFQDRAIECREQARGRIGDGVVPRFLGHV